MMRSLYSAVSGLKTHQTRMDVIGNNIANVNTEAFKSSRVTFSEIMYQTVSQASGGNAATGVGGINAKQIGLGVSTGATSISITTAGAAETTGNPFDLKLTDSQTTNFFIVSDGTNTFFTRSGSYYVDGNGFLCMTSTGYTLMGWQVDPTTGEIKKDTVSPLQVMSAYNQTSSPEATTLAQVSGILDKNDPNLKSSEDGYIMTLNFYDDLGYSYTARFSVKPINTGNESEDAGKYEVSLTDILDSNGRSYIEIYNSNVTNEAMKITTDQLFSTETMRQFVDETGNKVFKLIDADGNIQNTTPVYCQEVLAANTYYRDVNGYIYSADQVTNAQATDPTGAQVPVTALAVGEEYYVETVVNGTTVKQIITIPADQSVVPVYADEDKNELFELKVPAPEANNNASWFVFNDNGKQLLIEGNEIDWTTYDEETGTAKTMMGEDVTALKEGEYSYYKSNTYDDAGNITGEDWYISEVHIEQFEMIFDTNEGNFISIDGEDAVTLKMSKLLSNFVNQDTGRMSNFEDISIDFSSSLNLNNGGTSTMGALKGIDGDGSGKKLGALTGLSVDASGRVYGSYDNGNTTLLCQVAVAQFSNASGLEKVGDSCYQTTLNSGEFDGIGVEVSADGSAISTGELEMSNVDLSAQFTDMIITQRGFQANSRVITTSDTLLEELINLKR